MTRLMTTCSLCRARSILDTVLSVPSRAWLHQRPCPPLTLVGTCERDCRSDVPATFARWFQNGVDNSLHARVPDEASVRRAEFSMPMVGCVQWVIHLSHLDRKVLYYPL